MRTTHRACQRTGLGFNRKSILRVGSVRRVGGVGEDKEGGERERERETQRERQRRLSAHERERERD